MLLIGLESSRSPHQCFFRPLLPMLLRTTHFLPREPTERQFLFKSSRALARCLLLSALETYGPTRTTAYEPLPKWRSAARRPSCQDLVTLLRKQIEAQSFGQGTPTNVVGYPSMVQTAAA
jgi:hypothetical protein